VAQAGRGTRRIRHRAIVRLQRLSRLFPGSRTAGRRPKHDHALVLEAGHYKAAARRSDARADGFPTTRRRMMRSVKRRFFDRGQKGVGASVFIGALVWNENLPAPRRCEERSGRRNPERPPRRHGLLRCARNDAFEIRVDPMCFQGLRRQAVRSRPRKSPRSGVSGGVPRSRQD